MRNFFVVPLALGMLSNLTFAEPLVIGRFSQEPPDAKTPSGWKPLQFHRIKKYTEYSLVKEDDRIAVKAVSEAAASGLIAKLELNPKEYQIIEWSWKVSNVIAKGNPAHKNGDDYAARIYVTFKYDPSKLSMLERVKWNTVRLFYGEYPPHAGITYIWESKLPQGTGVRNPYTDRLQMIVVESGAPNLNRWMSYQRNLYEDYKQAFGEEPPSISGIAIMTDTDNTGESATAFYGDIQLKKASDPK